MALKHNGIIAIEGVIGVGKTTLAHALATALGAELLLESEIENPFLDRFYADRARYALACQLYFLVARLEQMSRPRLGQLPLVCDYILEKDRIFAAVNLEDAEWRLYQRYYDRMQADRGTHPEVIIYLKAGLDEVRRRIRDRGRELDQRLSPTYLEALVQAYDGYFDQVIDLPVVVVDTDSSNIAADPAAVQRLVDACRRAPRGLSYCNPVA
jgi:deoxyadenosine/deoxycytidine kinase